MSVIITCEAMRPIIAYLATSLDGFIADDRGNVEWLHDGNAFGFEEFMGRIDTVLMGRKTFDQLLSFDIPWPYRGKHCVVFTSKPPTVAFPDAEFVSTDPVEFARQLRRQPGKGIWVDGGATLFTRFAQAQAIDEWHLFVHPILLGAGVPVFWSAFPRTHLRRTHHQAYPCGVVHLGYETNRDSTPAHTLDTTSTGVASNPRSDNHGMGPGSGRQHLAMEGR